MKGFSLSKSTARKKIDVNSNVIVNKDDDIDEEKVKVDVILSIEGTKIKSTEEEKKPLVIPLILPVYNTSTNTSTSYGVAISEVKIENESKTIEQLAAEELVAGLTGTVKVEVDSVLTIKADTATTKKGAPLLLASIDPTLLEIKDDEARFKKDLQLRADDMDFKSDRYKAIPVEEFGAALLRGMGWEGYNKDDEAVSKKFDDPVKPRALRLGLGAAPKPPELKKGDKKANKELQEEWNKKVKEKINKQKLNEGDLIWIRDPLYAGRKARVVAVQGVPGLDKIRVRLENDSRIIDIKKTDAVLEDENATDTDYAAAFEMKNDSDLSKHDDDRKERDHHDSHKDDRGKRYDDRRDHRDYDDKRDRRDYDDRRDRRDRERKRSRSRENDRRRSRSRSRERKRDKY